LNRKEKLDLTSSDSSSPALPQPDELILVGGCSCIPAVKKALRRACRDSGVAKFVQKKAVSSTASDVETKNILDVGNGTAQHSQVPYAPYVNAFQSVTKYYSNALHDIVL